MIDEAYEWILRDINQEYRKLSPDELRDEIEERYRYLEYLDDMRRSGRRF